MASAVERVLTILFTDVEGSTAMRSRRGDALVDEILAVHEAIVRGEIERHGGEAVQFLGDGFLAAFGSARAALECAITIQRALEEHNTAQPDRQVRLRIGLHQGRVSERGGTLYGQAVHAAARVTAEAAGGQILLSAAARDAIGDAGPLVDRGLYWLKGFPQRWRLYEAQWRAGGVVTPAAVPQPAATPFVGREEERADLRRWVDQARGGHGGLVLLAGEAGVGKTRLRQEVEVDAQLLGMRVLVGHCAETGSTPYQPFVEILEDALISPRSPLVLREALGDVAAEIARLVPGLRRVVPDVPPAVELPPEQARRYLWNSVLEFLERASRDRPLLLTLEDLHWADDSTVLLLEYLAPRLPEMPVLVCGTYRDSEVDVEDALASAVSRLARRRLVDRLALRRLPREGVEAMIGGLAGSVPPAGLVNVIHAETDGNPFFVEEVYLHLAESGLLLDPDGRFRDDLEIDDLKVPDSIRTVVGGRLARLAPATREALAAAAVVGRSFPLDVAAVVAAQDREVFADGMDEAERARLVMPANDDGERLVFAHELIRQTLLADLTTVGRQRLHARVADAIEEDYGDDLESHASDLAYHLSRAGAGVEPSRLVRALRMAGSRAEETAAFEDAVAHFERALALVADDDLETRAGLLERLAMSRRGVGQWPEAVAAMDDALQAYEQLPDARAIGRLTWAMAYHLAWTTRFEEAVGIAGRGLLVLGDLPNPDRARLISATAWAVSLSGDYASAAAMFEQARGLAEQLGDKRALADVLHMETVHDFGFARFSHGVQAGFDAAVVFESEGALWDLCSVLSFVLYQQGAVGRVREAADLRQRVAPLAARLGHLGAEFLVVADRTKTDGVMAGDLNLVDELGAEQIEICERGGLPWLYIGYLYRGLAAHWRGDWDEAERLIRQADGLEARGAFSGQSRSLLAVHLALAGRAAEVDEIVEQRRAGLPRPGEVPTLGAWNTMFGLVEGLYLAGRHDEAAELGPLVDLALELPDRWDTIDCRLVETRAGIAAAAARRWDDAEQHYQDALRAAEAMPNHLEVADLRRLHAMLLADRGAPGDAARARDLLGQAGEAYHRIGMPRHEAIVEGLLTDLA